MPLFQILAGTAGRFTRSVLTAVAISRRGSVSLSRTPAVIGSRAIPLTRSASVPLSGTAAIIHSGSNRTSRLRTVRTIGSVYSRTAGFRIRSRSVETGTGLRTGFSMWAGRRVRYRRVAGIPHVVAVVIHRAAGKQRDWNRCRGPKKCSASHSAQLLSLREGMFLRTF